MADSSSRVFTVPSSVPFLPALAAALVDGRLITGFVPRQDPSLLPRATVYLPTRRAARLFGFEILHALGTEGTLLPRILPLGDVDEDELAFADEDGSEAHLPAISAANRRLMLAKLVLAWARTLPPGDSLLSASPSAAITLSDELARVLDDLVLAGASFAQLDDAIPEGLDRYWKLSYDFLRIVGEYWPAHLQEKGLIDPTTRREKLLARELLLLKAGGSGPVVAAGSTGTLPAVARLLATIAAKPDGAVVLPGLDQVLDEASFNVIGGSKDVPPSQGHPQYGLQQLLHQLKIKRAEVVELAKPQFPFREKLLSEAFRPASTTDRWQQKDSSTLGGKSLADITVLEAADPREEALAIAISLRETLETKEAYAALITPDRALARRVAAELTRWNIVADDSAGLPLSETEAGILARAISDVAAENLAPVPLVTFLRHPLSGFAKEERAINALEIGALRGPRPAPGAAALIDLLRSEKLKTFRKHDPKALLSTSDWDAAIDLVEHVAKALSSLITLENAGPLPFGRFLEAHHRTIDACGLNLGSNARPDVRKLDETLQDLGESSVDAFDLTLSDYAEIFTELTRNQTVRPLLDPQSRIRILGPLEARLVTFDRVVLGGLNEGSWPPDARTDAFLNRPIRRELGLNLPERRIGLAAHDFVQAAGARELVLTRARRQGGAETVASRFWQRIEAVSPKDAWEESCQRGKTLLRLARMLDRPSEKFAPILPPAPRPPIAERPVQLSVTEVRDLVRDPYTIYARHILRLAPLDDIDADPGVAERGIILHEALARFTEAFPSELPKNLIEEILKFGDAAFESYRRFPGASAIWWPRFKRVASWFAEEEVKRRKNIKSQLPEISGKIVFDVGGNGFTLTTRADRIDFFEEGSLGLYDYKTGAVPTLPQAVAGLEPQLPLEAAIVREGGFKNVPARTRISDIAAIKLSGGNPAGIVRSLNPATATAQVRKALEPHQITTCDELADFALQRLKTLLARYADQKTPYRSVPRPKWRLRYGQYDHLARIKEWSDSERSGE